MFTPLPNLDDRRWDDLVQEGVSLIPVHAPDWTDHNAHDPGITLLELFAYVTERQIFRVNRVPGARKRRMLELLGFSPHPPRPARIVASFALRSGRDPVMLPATAEFLAGSAPYRTLRALTVTGARIASLTRRAGGIETDLTGAVTRAEPFTVFDAEPRGDDALTMRIESRARPGDRLSLYIRLASWSREVRRESLRDRCRERQACASPPGPCGSRRRRERCRCRHPGEVLLAWETLDAGNEPWRPAEVFDGTRGLTQAGTIVLTVPPGSAGSLTLRLRPREGQWDSPRVVRALVPDAVEAEQARPVWHSFPIAREAIVEGDPPKPGERSRLAIATNASEEITRLSFLPGTGPGPLVAILGYRAPGSDPGVLTVDLVPLRRGDDAPWQEFRLTTAPATVLGTSVYSLESEGGWRTWRQRPDMAASGAADADWVCDLEGRCRFGDGARGRVLPEGAVAFARVRETLGTNSAAIEGASLRLDASPRNRALLGDVGIISDQLEATTVAWMLEQGRGAETLAEALLRAGTERELTERAITLSDAERIARETPGRDIARAVARANTHPGLLGVAAPGVVTLVVVPNRPGPRPFPSPSLIRAVRRRLERTRLLGTAFRVIGPDYRSVGCRALLRARREAGPAQVRGRAVAALDIHLDPLRGGADGTGWPLGRDVYRSEIMALLEAIEGVDHVLSLELLTEQGEAACGDLCLGPLTLVAPAPHEIEVLR